MRFLRRPFKQASHTRECLPMDQQPNPAAAQPDGKGERNPKAQTVKAIHQTSKNTGAKSCAQVRDQIPGTVFLGQQVRDPPYRERTEDKAPDWIAVVHLVPRPCRF